MTKNDWILAQIKSLYKMRHEEGIEVFGEKGMVPHWAWHAQYRKDISLLVDQLRGKNPSTPLTGWATRADFEQDNPTIPRIG